MTQRRGFRFRPPLVDVSPAIDWVLERAFGPTHEGGAPLRRVSDPEALLDTCTSFGLLGRVRSRGAEETLEAELGDAVLRTFDAETRRLAVASLVHRGRAVEVAEVAANLDFRVIFLKGAALDLKGRTRPGSRPMGDIDVLATSAEAERLHTALKRRGYRETGQDAPRHHLPRLVHESGVVLEIHHRMRGLIADADPGRPGLDGPAGSDPEATADECRAAGCLEALELRGALCFVPTDELMLAHLMAHALDQHAMTPEAYQAFRVVGDLQDLGALDEGSEALWRTASRWTAASVSERESAALRELGMSLAAGQRASEIAGGDGDAARLLRHLLAGELDESYRSALKLRRELEVPPGSGRVSAHIASAARAVLLSRSRIDAIYGRPRSKLGYLGWRLWRPFDLLGRLVASGWAAVRLRWWPRGRPRGSSVARKRV